MRSFLIILSIFWLCTSCSEEGSTQSKSSTEDLLEEGKWMIQSVETPTERMKKGVIFSKDKQVFYIDSQGKVIPTNQEIVYELKGDSLRIVDFNFESRFIEEKGTMISLINIIDDSKVELEVIFPEKNRIVLINEEL
jgi:transcriptional regulator with PAS, ATPase and Fis domain